jgi:hypothetical protein
VAVAAPGTPTRSHAKTPGRGCSAVDGVRWRRRLAIGVTGCRADVVPQSAGALNGATTGGESPGSDVHRQIPRIGAGDANAPGYTRSPRVHHRRAGRSPAVARRARSRQHATRARRCATTEPAAASTDTPPTSSAPSSPEPPDEAPNRLAITPADRANCALFAVGVKSRGRLRRTGSARLGWVGCAEPRPIDGGCDAEHERTVVLPW